VLSIERLMQRVLLSPQNTSILISELAGVVTTSTDEAQTAIMMTTAMSNAAILKRRLGSGMSAR
jgi:hypothetical protein